MVEIVVYLFMPSTQARVHSCLVFVLMMYTVPCLRADFNLLVKSIYVFKSLHHFFARLKEFLFSSSGLKIVISPPTSENLYSH